MILRSVSDLLPDTDVDREQLIERIARDGMLFKIPIWLE